jgi:hypothetical protein
MSSRQDQARTGNLIIDINRAIRSVVERALRKAVPRPELELERERLLAAVEHNDRDAIVDVIRIAILVLADDLAVSNGREDELPISYVLLAALVAAGKDLQGRAGELANNILTEIEEKEEAAS